MFKEYFYLIVNRISWVLWNSGQCQSYSRLWDWKKNGNSCKKEKKKNTEIVASWVQWLGVIHVPVWKNDSLACMHAVPVEWTRFECSRETRRLDPHSLYAPRRTLLGFTIERDMRHSSYEKSIRRKGFCRST